MHKAFRTVAIISTSILIFGFVLQTTVFAQDPYGIQKAREINVGQSEDVKGVVAQIINIVLGFLGILAVIIIIYAGFKWMTAAGNEEQVTDARRMLVQAVAGLVIIFLAWAIANFAIDQLGRATDAPIQ